MNTNKKVALDKNGNYEGHAFNKAMLEAKLSGNHMKVILAYMNVGGFNPKDSVFLARKDYEAFGMVRQTVSTLRTELVEAGWLIKDTSRKSKADYEYYHVAIGGPVAKRDKGRRNSGHQVSENKTPPVAIQDTELTTELTTSTNELNNINARAVGASQSSGKPSDSTLPENRIKDKENTEELPALRAAHVSPIDSYSLNSPKVPGSSPIGLNSTVVVKEELEDKGVSHFTTPSCPQCKAPDFEAVCWECEYRG